MKATVRLLLASAALLGPAPAPAADAARPFPRGVRQEIEVLEINFDRAVARVSVPHAGMLIGRAETTRGYRLPGYGILFVLAPRALPGGPAVYVVRRGPGPGGPVRLRVPPPPPGADPWEALVDDPAWEPERVEELERQVLVLQHVAEAERRAAEEDMERIVRDVRIRFSAPAPAPAAAPPPDTGDDASGEGAVDPSPPPSGDDLQLPATPPWRFWFEAGPAGEERSPDRVVAEVKAAVISALDAQAARIVGLRADEFVTVAVDFVPGGLFASPARPQRTLVVRARQRDLEARARGAIGTGELEERVEVFEY